MSRFLSYFTDEEGAGAGSFEQAAMIYRVSGELEKYFGSGDELLGARPARRAFGNRLMLRLVQPSKSL